jgi:hypothetical protein
MADQTVSVSGPVSIKSDSVQRVALELADKINYYVDGNTPRDREYWLNLYSQCLQVVGGRDVKKVLAGQ